MSKTRRILNRRLIFAAAVVLCALTLGAVAEAGTYIVTLSSGATFESRYKPQVAPWDGSKILVLSDVGNWVSLKRASVTSVRSTSENRGLGFVIDNTTISLGWAPNDNLTPEQEAEAAQAAARAGLGAPQQPNYSINQFVEPNATQGLPSNLLGGSNNSGYPSGMLVPLSSMPAVNQGSQGSSSPPVNEQ